MKNILIKKIAIKVVTLAFIVTASITATITLANNGFAQAISRQQQLHNHDKPLDTVNITKAVLTLGDIFVNTALNRNLPLFRSPPPGDQVWLKLDELAKVLANNGIHWQKPQFPQKILVKRKGTVVTDKMLEKIILAKLVEQQTLTKEKADMMAFDFITRPQNIYISQAEGQPLNLITLKLLQQGKKSKALVKVLMQVRDYDESSDFVIVAQIEQEIRLPVLQQQVKRGDKILPNIIGYKKFKVANIKKTVVKTKEDIDGFIANADIKPDSPILSAQIKKQKEIIKNNLVIVQYAKSGLEIAMQAKALEEGFKGQLIRVKNLRSNKILNALVIDTGKVRIVR